VFSSLPDIIYKGISLLASDLTPPLFKLENVSYTYENAVPALDSINLEIHNGEKIAVLGANGCGKSTLLKILDGLYFPTSGSAAYSGATLSEAVFRDEAFNTTFRSKVGLVFQDSDVQLFLPTVRDEVAFAPLQLDISQEEVRERVEKALQALHIEGLRERAPHQLSSGEKKKVALASLLTLEPQVWLFDEPSAGLDPRTVAWLTEFIDEQGNAGKTILLATHDLELTRAVADRVCLMNEAHQITFDGATPEVLANHKLLSSTNLI
jgi:cobalt/nickel transport system ATP-binding protein